MNSQAIYPLQINGSMTVPGGTFSNVGINGSGRITSDCQCEEFGVNGNAQITGSVTAREIEVNGKAAFHGKLKAEDIHINGKAEVKGEVKANTVVIHGHLEAEGDVSSESFISKGKTVIRGNCETEVFMSKGAINITELLNADNIEIKLNTDGYIKEIGGGEISIKREAAHNLFFDKLLSVLSSGKTTSLKAEMIEGDRIYMEYCTVGTVRGTDIEIGPGCSIGRLEYGNDPKIDSTSTVKEKSRI
ncbi:polymer-forming cytoskeletal protein [Peribacillus sp. SCS-26]|uniref:polymer-forming cytoskeletal protein n=1 Tax=Paraperibacillus marinus TaxID=3115295 RepID=UPI003906D1BF